MSEYNAAYWHDELKAYRDEYERWEQRADKVLKRYRDDRKESENLESRFNILWSNIKTLKPAIYSRIPKPEVARRFKDNDPVARTASIIIERCLDFELKQYNDFHSSMSNCVEDRLLPGRGVAWLRYEPLVETVDADPWLSEDDLAEEDYAGGMQGGEDNADGLAEIAEAEQQPLEQITHETCPIDYVHWKDFAYLPARTWEEVTWVARRVYLSREEGISRFGDVFEQVPLTHKPKSDDNEKRDHTDKKKAEVWEIWCKPEKSCFWIADGFQELLDERQDPLELENFFPCPKPLFATTTTGSLVPVPDFALYQDQADELDEICSRIRHLTKALKAMGIYAAEATAVSRLLKEGQDGVMIPVENWHAFMEAGGLDKCMQLVDVKYVAEVLIRLYQAKDQLKQTIYEITGISDIIRGATAASETATAQQIKSQFASIRLNDMKDDVARFARDLLRMKAEVICSKYQPQTLIAASGIMHTNDAQFAEQAIQLLQNETLRDFSINIEDDTLVQLDEQKDKENRVEFLKAVADYMKMSSEIAQGSPDIAPLMGEMLLFGVRGFKVGREIEGSIESTVERIKQQLAAKQQQPKQPNPEQIKMQAEQQQKQMEMQIEQQKASLEKQTEDAKMQMQKYVADLEAQVQLTIAREKLALEKMRIEYEAQNNMQIRGINYDATI